MNDKTLSTLEYNKIIDRLARMTSFGPSRERVAALRPSNDIAEVRRALAETTEARDLLEIKANFSVGGARDVRAAVRRAQLGGTLEAADLLDVQATLRSARATRATILKLADRLPLLARVAGALADCPRLDEEIGRCLGPRGEVVDSASENLRRVRIAVRLAHDRLLDKLNAMVASPSYRQALQEPIVTQREGRYVLPVKSDFRGQLRGVVHDQSASGATLYVEPLVTVELNNRWRELQLEEEREVQRILKDLSIGVAAEADTLSRDVHVLAEIDFALTKARYAGLGNCVEPTVSGPGENRRRAGEPGDSPVLELRQARHPLLTGEVVPIDAWIGPDFRALVITGPNTGGKTVALKTIGLLTLMAQAGLHIPAAEGSSIHVFGGVYADIGDEQSIEQSLSTFSSHMRNIVDILTVANEESLVLLDELGAGTDPAEGSALARAILSFLLERGSIVVATTHYSELKAFAHLTPGLRNASVEFDVESLSPTYRLSIGLPGRSNALAIATRLGLSREIVRHARGLMDPKNVEVEALLRRIREEQRAAAAAKFEAERSMAAARELEARLSKAWRDIEDERARVLAAAREESEAELESVRRRVAQALATLQAADTISAGGLRQAADELRAARQHLVGLSPVKAPPPVVPPVSGDKSEPSRPLKPGDTVWIVSLQQHGELVSVPKGREEVEVRLGALKTRVKASDLEPAREGGPPPPRRPDAAPPRLAPAIERDVAPMQIDLRGMRAEEALEVVDKYVHDAYLSGLPFVRIVHGKGTGVLRQVVRELLGRHPLVRSVRTAEEREGGEGATIAQLAS